MTVNKSEESTVEALCKKLAAVSLELRNTQLDLMVAEEDLEACQTDLETVTSSLAETELELKNTKAVLANSEQARREANHDRVIARPENKQEVFVVLKFRSPQPLPGGAYRLFTLQRKSVQSTLDQFIANNPDFDAVEMDELRFDLSPRGQLVYQHMMGDKHAPIKFSRRNFVLKNGKTEEDMIEYITRIFNTHTQD